MTWLKDSNTHLNKSEHDNSKSDNSALLCCSDCSNCDFEAYEQDKEHEMIYGKPKGMHWCAEAQRRTGTKTGCGYERRFGKCGEQAIYWI